MKFSAAVFMILIVAGCAASPSGKGAGSARESSDPRAKLFKQKCIACHTLPDPGDSGDKGWHEILDDHQKKFSLSDSDKARLLQYLTNEE